MNRQCISLLVALAIALVGSAAAAGVQRRSTSPQPSRTDQAFFKGTVTDVLAPRLFTMKQEDGQGPELLVLAPRELSTVKGAIVAVSGTMRRFTFSEIGQVRGWSDLDPQLRARFAGRPVLIATAVLSSEPQPTASAQSRQAEPPANEPSRLPSATSEAASLPLPASTLVDFIQTFAGHSVRIQNARVVGLITPAVFLVEPATRYLKDMGQRDRLAVFVDTGSLRVAPDLLVGSIVQLEGVARTVLSMQATGEFSWPDKLDQHAIDRLEIRAALVARSVHTAEGTELTDRR